MRIFNKKNRLVCNNLITLVAIMLVVLMSINSCMDDSTGTNNRGNVTITSIEPLTATTGDTIIVNGSNFNELGPNIVVFSGESSAVKPIERSNSQLKVMVPETAIDGKITVKLGPGNIATSEEEIDLVPKPFINSVSLNYGMAGTEIEIYGGKFSEENGSDNNLNVMFGSTEGIINSVSPSQISVTVPAGATTGSPDKLNVRVIRSGISSNSIPFNYETETQQLITDNFNRDDTDEITGSSSSNPIGGGWKVYKGKWKILDNEIMSRHNNGAGQNNMVHTGTMRPTQPVTSFEFSADVKLKTAANSRFGGLVFNVQDNENYYLLRFNTSIGNTQLIRVENGGFTGVLAMKKFSEIENDTFYRIVVTSDQLYSFTIKVTTTDGQVVGQLDAVDSNQTYRDGYVGFHNRVEDVVFDNFKYESTVE